MCVCSFLEAGENKFVFVFVFFPPTCFWYPLITWNFSCSLFLGLFLSKYFFFFNPKQIILLNLKWPPNEIQEVLCRGKPNKRRWNRGRRGGHPQYLLGGWTPLRWSSYPFFPTPSSPLTPRNVLCSISQWENTIGTSLKNSNWKCVCVLKWVQM